MRSLLAAVFTLVLAAGVTYAAAETYAVDPVHSTVLFKIKHLGISYTYGRFNDVSGSFLLDEDPAKSMIAVSVKAASVDTHNAKRDAHLKGPDFFSVKEFPTITFKSTAIKKEGNAYTITGDLTLHGVTKSITVEATHVGSGKDPWGGYRTGFDMTFSIKRSDYGMKNLLEAAGDDVQLTVGVEGIRK